MKELTPKDIVVELDRFIIGQHVAKKAVAIALRNRWRRKQVQGSLQDEIVPKNILMIGPTGCGKTEIARRLARLANAPFLKIEATKFTEVGYVGRDVESIIRDLVEIAVKLVRAREHQRVYDKAEAAAQERILDALVGDSASADTRRKFREKLLAGELDDKEVELEVADNDTSSFNSFDIPGMPGGQMGVLNISDMLNKAMGGGRTKTRRMTVAQSHKLLINEESDKLLDQEKVVQEALRAVEQDGIVFIDEIDKVCARSDVKGGEVSREGVQRDLLPLIEGTMVTTKYGIVKTDHILFIASGAFHMAKPADLLPELQGRLPIRVELHALTEADMQRILTEPEASLTKQYTALLAVEDVHITFTECGIKALASLATIFNREIENIGARRLHTIMEKLMEEISYEASERKGESLTINADYVQTHVGHMAEKVNLERFIL
ncbi:MAG: ATP-dependent protease ATPase subunit HslU [Candidatus Kapaibacterium sp.]|nr:MAG: ATP-dependent protease ATPase subunit HslU [Candidatus Kapabacteria bacterium]